MTPLERAREFAQEAFGPFGVNIEPYAAIIAELIEGAVAELEADNEQLRDDSKMLSLCEGDRKWMAAEIERLRALEDRANRCAASWESLRAENARLRATLREDRKYLAGLCGCAASSGCGAAIRRAEIDRILNSATDGRG